MRASARSGLFLGLGAPLTRPGRSALAPGRGSGVGGEAESGKGPVEMGTGDESTGTLYITGVTRQLGAAGAQILRVEEAWAGGPRGTCRDTMRLQRDWTTGRNHLLHVSLTARPPKPKVEANFRPGRGGPAPEAYLQGSAAEEFAAGFQVCFGLCDGICRKRPALPESSPLSPQRLQQQVGLHPGAAVLRHAWGLLARWPGVHTTHGSASPVFGPGR